MAYLDKVRFVAGDEVEGVPVKVWQGYDAAALNGSAGFDMVYVTAETLRLMAEYDWDNVKDRDFDRLHNAPEGFWSMLSFGGDYSPPPPPGTNPADVRRPQTIVAPDGVTPLYLVGEWTIVIVQRFNPNGGRTYDIITNPEIGVESKVGEGHWGVWENVNPVVGIAEPVGFVVNPAYWAEGRGDTPPFARHDDDDDDEELDADEMEAAGISPIDPTRKHPVLMSHLTEDEKARVVTYWATGILPEPEPEPAKVATVTIILTDGTEATMTFEPLAPEGQLDQSGTSYSGQTPEGFSVIEDAISTAVAEAGLWPA